MGHATNPLVYKRLPFDSDKDFTPISLIATFPQLVMVNPKVPAKTLADLLALAKKASPPMTYASGGNGSSQHFAGALFTGTSPASRFRSGEGACGSSKTHSASYRDVATVDEAGVPGYQSVAWYGLVGPKGMPNQILEKLSAAVVKAAHSSAVTGVVAQQGGDVVASTPQEFADFIQAERTRYAPIVREAEMMVE